MNPKLISFKLCPFVQRAAIVLAHKNIDHHVEHIDLRSPPSWFLDISPLKKVPVLQIENYVIFDSSVICEFLDEAYSPKLHPEDIFLRASNRSWMEFCNDTIMRVYKMTVAESEEKFIELKNDIWNSFDQLEKSVKGTPFFNGNRFSLVDCSFAPMLQRLNYLDMLDINIFNFDRHPKIVKWKDNLISHDSIIKSEITNQREMFYEFVKKNEGYAANKII